MEEKLIMQIEEIINHKIRPRTRVDGGDIKLEKVEDGVVYIAAYADCAVCPCCEPELKWWIKKQLQKALSMHIEVVVARKVPYYYV